jgi:hypothetical protein
MLRVVTIAFCLSLAGCASPPTSPKVWKTDDFARASNPEMVDIAAACLQHRFASLRSWPGDFLYYLHVQNADWRAVLDRVDNPILKTFVYGSRDHFWGDDGYRDRATGLRVYTIGISLEGRLPLSGKAQVYVTLDVGTNLGGSGEIYTLEKKDGRWVVVNAEKKWIS